MYHNYCVVSDTLRQWLLSENISFCFFVSLDLLHNQLISHSIRTLIQNSGTPTIQCKQDHYLKHFMSLCGPLFRQDCKCKLSILEGPYLVYWKFALQQAMSAVLGILSLYLTCAGKEYFFCIYKQNQTLINFHQMLIFIL